MTLPSPGSVFWKKRPGQRRAMADRTVEAAAFGQMPHDAIGVIHALAARVVQRFARIVFFIAVPGHLGHGRENLRLAGISAVKGSTSAATAKA